MTNPDTGKPLTKNDYIEIRWSRDLEYIARIRAAESLLTMDHLRTNGNSCFAIQSKNGTRSYAEVVAWNGSDSMIQGIEQWYSEKSDWVNETAGAVTGHYTIMISPNNKYVGLGTFCSDQCSFRYNSTAGEFSSMNELVETPMEMSGECIQLLEISKGYLIGDVQIKGSQVGVVNEVSPHALTISAEYSNYTTQGLMFIDANWTSSKESVAIVSSGDVYAVGSGTSRITASSGSGYSASIDFTVTSASS